MLSMAFITNPQKACAHSSLYINNQDKKFGGSAVRTYFKWGVSCRKICYSFASFIRMNLKNGFKLRNCIIKTQNHQLSQICLYTIWTCFYQCLSSSSSSSWFRSVHQGLWLYQGVLYWIHFTICWYCSLFGLESWSLVVSQFFVCLCFVIEWVHLRNQKNNTIFTTLSTIKKTSTRIYR